MLQRRIGPLPIWTWFLILVLGVYLFLRFRANRGGQSSTINDADNLTSQQSTLVPWSTDIFVNIPQQTVPPSTSKGPIITVPPKTTPRYGGINSWLANPPQNPGPRQTSVTYQVPPGSEPMRSATLASLFGFNGQPRTFRSNPLVIPV